LTYGTLKKQKEEILMTALFCMMSIVKHLRMRPKEINTKARVVCKISINAEDKFFYCMSPCSVVENYQAICKKPIRVFTAVRTSNVKSKIRLGEINV